ncbi:MAG: transcription elongation factor [Burkholderiales bacterium]|nr:transcription elongation factor [Opitutaceae bacterium]
MSKEPLRVAVLSALQAELSRQTSAALDAREESISEESRAENKYDTHAQEAAYLAEGQARLASELAVALAAWRALVFPPAGHSVAQLGSLVTLAVGSRTDHILLGPNNGGLTFSLPPTPDTAPDAAPGTAPLEITVVTPASPLGRSLLGRAVGDSLPPARKGGPTSGVSALA